MKEVAQKIKRAAAAIRDLRKSRPGEFRWSIYGLGVGALVGAVFVGGIGIAALGTAFGAPASAILAVIGGMIGNRVGVEKDKAASKSMRPPIEAASNSR
jgi:predicted lipid-binding transport protein (Tim44 family)